MPRRLFAAAVAGALALAALTGCRSDPRIAAYVDGTQISESQVDQMISDARLHADRDNAGKDKNNPNAVLETVPSRVDVVTVLAAQVITKKVMNARKLPPVSSNQQLAQVNSGPAGSSYALALADVQSSIEALAEADGNGFQPTDADLRLAYDNAVAAGAAPAGAFDQVKPALLQVTTLAPNLAARSDLIKAVPPEAITVNLRYTPLAFPIESLQTQDGKTFVAVSLPLGKASTAGPAVVDIAPSPSAQLNQPVQ